VAMLMGESTSMAEWAPWIRVNAVGEKVKLCGGSKTGTGGERKTSQERGEEGYSELLPRLKKADIIGRSNL